jgi:hypothetical protein
VTSVNFIGLDIHKKTISYCVKDAAGEVLAEGTIAATRVHLESWIVALLFIWRKFLRGKWRISGASGSRMASPLSLPRKETHVVWI